MGDVLPRNSIGLEVRRRIAQVLVERGEARVLIMTAATDCHETVIAVTLNIRARFERVIPTALGFSDEPGRFCVNLPLFAVQSNVQETLAAMTL